jgi:hypothetical protein
VGDAATIAAANAEAAAAAAATGGGSYRGGIKRVGFRTQPSSGESGCASSGGIILCGSNGGGDSDGV